MAFLLLSGSDWMLVLEWVIKGGAALGSVLAVGRILHTKVFAPLKRYETEWMSRGAQLDLLLSELAVIKSEFKPNHGSSLRDAIDAMDKKLHFLDHQLRTLLTDDEKAVFVTDANGACIWANNSYLNLCGWSMDRVLGLGWKNSIPDTERDKVVAEWDSAIEDHRDFFMKFHYQPPSGSLVPVEVHATFILDPTQAKLLGHIGIAKRRVVTARPNGSLG